MRFKRSDSLDLPLVPEAYIGRTYVALDPTHPGVSYGDILLIVKGLFNYQLVNLTTNTSQPLGGAVALQSVVDSPAYYEEVVLDEPIGFKRK